jgi:type I restriction enzyme M protein
VLSNRKPDHRRGRIQLIDATQWFKPLRKNLGKKNCELSEEDIRRICDTYLAFEETAQSKVFENAAFGYWKLKVERPLRLHSQLSRKAIETLRFASGDQELRSEIYDRFGERIFEDFDSVKDQLERMLGDWGTGDEEEDSEEEGTRRKGLPEKKKKKLLDARTWERDARLVETAEALRRELGDALFEDHNVFRDAVDVALKKLGIKLGAADLKVILRAVSWREETAPPVTAKIHKPGKVEPDPIYGRYEASMNRKKCVVEYEPDPDLRDSEQVPLLEDGGIEAFIRREVLPYTPDAWIDDSATKIGYEISFTRHFYKPQPLRTLDEIRADIIELKKETEGLLDEIVMGGAR